jgi:hypothetical protein
MAALQAFPVITLKFLNVAKWPVVASQDGIVEPLFILDTPPLIK